MDKTEREIFDKKYFSYVKLIVVLRALGVARHLNVVTLFQAMLDKLSETK